MSEETRDHQARPRAEGGGVRGGWLAAFIVSLALNMLFIGALVGAWWQRQQHAPSQPAVQSPQPERGRLRGPRLRAALLRRPGVLELRAAHHLMRALPRERRRALRRLWRTDRPDVREAMRAVRAARTRLIRALRREPEDVPAAARAWHAMMEQQQRLLQWQRVALERFLQALTPEERRRYAQILARLRGGGR